MRPSKLARRWASRRQARRHYFELSNQADTIMQGLRRTADPAERAVLLERLADREAQMAAVHTAAFGPDPIAEEGGRDLAESTSMSADLLRMLAETERAVASADWTAAGDLRVGSRVWTGDRWAEVCWGRAGFRVIHAGLGQGQSTLVLAKADSA